MELTKEQATAIGRARNVLIVQAENPDGDSLGSALALACIMRDMGKIANLYCPVQMPTYLRFFKGWEEVSTEINNPSAIDLVLIVDTCSASLMLKALANPDLARLLDNVPVIAFDHHDGVEPDLPEQVSYVIDGSAVATGQLLYDVAVHNHWPLSTEAATDLYSSIQADSLGLITPNTTAHSFEVCAELVKLGVSPALVDEARRELSKKQPRILEYKGRLIERIQYFNSGRTSLVHIPFAEIHEYSNDYNPTMLVIDEMRSVIGVDVAIGLKTYPDGKLTGKIRSNIPVANIIAKAFGGDGHPNAAGFKTYADLDEFKVELIAQLERIYVDYDNAQANNISGSTNAFRIVKKG